MVVDYKINQFFKKSKFKRDRMLLEKMIDVSPDELAFKLANCSTYLILAKCRTPEEIRYRLYHAFFCKNRLCPLCTRLKQRKRLKNLWNNRELINSKNPYLILSFTIRSVAIQQQRETVIRMAKAFSSLRKYPCWKSVIGYVRALETTRGKTADCHQTHPHLHALLQVSPQYFGKGYIKHEEWLRSWQSAYGDPSITQVNVQRLKPKKGSDDLFTGFYEGIKYELKPESWLQADDEKNSAPKEGLKNWLLIYSQQMKNIRSLSTGGTLKGILTEPKKLTDDDFEDEQIIQFLKYEWRQGDYNFLTELAKDQVEALNFIENFRSHPHYFDGKKIDKP